MPVDPPAVHACACVICQAGQDAGVMQYHRQINLLLSRLSEPQRRWYAAVLADDPHGPGAQALPLITGLHPDTIRRGRVEVAAGLADQPAARQRRPGGGRPPTEKKIPM